MAYSHCKTRIVNLIDLEIPESATEIEYKQHYERICSSHAPASQCLADAISSVALGIAPPVAFPTETVYGLGADATNRASISGIFAAKGRPSDNPLIVHVASKDHLERLTGEPLPAIYHDLVREHWPGPLTVLVPVSKTNSPFAENVHPGQQTIGFRVPKSKYARFFIAATGKPIAGPSANSSGKPSPTTAQHVMDDLNGKINFILDGGNCDVGVESTVVDGLCDPPLILRPGGLGQDDLIAHGKKYGNKWANVGIGYKQLHETDATTTTVNGSTANDEAPRAPGMKYKHYAPQGRMILFDGSDSFNSVRTQLDKLLETGGPSLNGTSREISAASASLPSIAILPSTSWPTYADLPVTPHPDQRGSQHDVMVYRDHVIHSIPLGRAPKQIAQNLFAALRTCDDLGCRYILAEAPTKEKGLGLTNGNGGDGVGEVVQQRREQLVHEFDAVLERMRKASSSIVSQTTSDGGNPRTAHH